MKINYLYDRSLVLPGLIVPAGGTVIKRKPGLAPAFAFRQFKGSVRYLSRRSMPERPPPPMMILAILVRLTPLYVVKVPPITAFGLVNYTGWHRPDHRCRCRDRSWRSKDPSPFSRAIWFLPTLPYRRKVPADDDLVGGPLTLHGINGAVGTGRVESVVQYAIAAEPGEIVTGGVVAADYLGKCAAQGDHPGVMSSPRPPFTSPLKITT